ncbi:prolyl hydroxylase family protein [Chitinimonas sp.]|uniref:prolyl hydroxylase family protein n=1 Tax=Chitinimonas sp. TaxID=1934313 RepID=UPI0035AF75F0
MKYREEMALAGIRLERLFTRLQAEQLCRELDADTGWYAAKVVDADSADGVALRPSDRLAEGNGLASLPKVVSRFEARVLQRILPWVLDHYRPNIDCVSEFNAVRYGPGGGYRVHIDNGPGLDYRVFTVVCYLNDDFVGGETHFPDIDLSARPDAGMAIVFPSEYPHAALPVVAGVKRVLVCWLHGPKAPRWL